MIFVRRLTAVSQAVVKRSERDLVLIKLVDADRVLVPYILARFFQKSSGGQKNLVILH